MRRPAVRPTLKIMTIDRRVLLRGMGWAAAAGTPGAALAASPGRSMTRPVFRSPAAHPVTAVAGHWAADRPPVVPRVAWRTGTAVAHTPPSSYAPSIHAVFVHHTGSGNRYRRGDVPALIQSFYDGHVESNAWDDIGYNFLVDRMGTIYEGRAGGVGSAVVGAHTLGFNVGTVGVAAIGSFGPGSEVPEPMLESIARLAAWKLGMYGVDARASTVLVSTSDRARYRKGTPAVFRTVSGHRDGYSTVCPGDALYAMLPAVRGRAFQLQGRMHGLLRPPVVPDRPVPPSFLLRTPT
jgi:uncharacterized protein with LGFP repeats